MPLDWRSLQGLPQASDYGSHTDIGFRDTFFCAHPKLNRSANHDTKPNGQINSVACKYADASADWKGCNEFGKLRYPSLKSTRRLIFASVNRRVRTR